MRDDRGELDMDQAIDDKQEPASTIGHWDRLFEGGLNVHIPELGGLRGENYFYGLVQMQEQCAKAQFEAARVQAQANTIALIGQLGLSFDASGSLSERDEERLYRALKLIRSNAEFLHPDVPIG